MRSERMRCVFLPVVLVLTTAPTMASAESLVCQPIRRGESAASVARRITGDGRNAYQAWFQIQNASSRPVPKSQYNNIRAGWRACVLKHAIESRTVAFEPTAEAPVVAAAEPIASASVAPAAPVTPVAAAARDLTMMWFGAAMVVPWLGWRAFDRYLTRRHTRSIVVRYFVDRFVHEFERPLRIDEADRPIRSQFRSRLRPGRFDVLLAPSQGRRYPNLSD